LDVAKNNVTEARARDTSTVEVEGTM
jgi:hypothetical protein